MQHRVENTGWRWARFTYKASQLYSTWPHTSTSSPDSDRIEKYRSTDCRHGTSIHSFLLMLWFLIPAKEEERTDGENRLYKAAEAVFSLFFLIYIFIYITLQPSHNKTCCEVVECFFFFIRFLFSACSAALHRGLAAGRNVWRGPKATRQQGEIFGREGGGGGVMLREHRCFCVTAASSLTLQRVRRALV